MIEQHAVVQGESDEADITRISAHWSRVEPGIALGYRDRVDTLEYSDAWSTAEFGAEAEGPGLRPIRSSDESVFVSTLVLWRVEFLDSLEADFP